MTPDRAKFNKEVEKGLLDRGVNIPIRAMTEQETAEQRIKIQADQIASLKRHIGRLETQLANELLEDDGSPLTPHGEAIAAGDGTLHGAIDYWQQQAFTMAAGQCIVKSGGLMGDDHGHQYCDMERQRDEWKRKAEESARDAARYRFIRDDDNWQDDAPDTATWDNLGELSMAEFDAAVDKKMSAAYWEKNPIQAAIAAKGEA